MIERATNNCIPDNVRKLIIHRYLEKPETVSEFPDLFKVSGYQIQRITSLHVTTGKEEEKPQTQG